MKSEPLFFLFVCLVSTANCLECLKCFYATDPSKCRYKEQCPENQKCSRQKFSDRYGVHYHLSCTDELECKRDKSLLFGRRKRISSSYEIHCCNSSLCNGILDHVTANATDSGGTSSKPLIVSSVPTMNTSMVTDLHNMATTLQIPNNSSKVTDSHSSSTTDPLKTNSIPSLSSSSVMPSCDDHEDCDILIQGFNACADEEIAMGYCRKSCGMCGVSAPPPCVDENHECQLLIDHLHVCRNRTFAERRCRKSCYLCHNWTKSTIPPTISVTLPTTDASQCLDRESCRILKEINICSNSLTAQLCPVYCGICGNHSSQNGGNGKTTQHYTQNSTSTSVVQSSIATNKPTMNSRTSSLSSQAVTNHLPSTSVTSVQTVTMVNIPNTTLPVFNTTSALKSTLPFDKASSISTTPASSKTSNISQECIDNLGTASCQQLIRDQPNGCQDYLILSECKLSCRNCTSSVSHKTTSRVTSTGTASTSTRPASTSSTTASTSATTASTSATTASTVKVTTTKKQPQFGVAVIG